jgi:DNA-binding NarL/FixJ family response regulator
MARRVLLADDHAIVRQGIRALLERAGYQVVAEAGNGHEAVDLAIALAPDVAVLDLAMPLLNGLEAARAIRQAAPRTRTLLLTMHTEDEYVLAALEAGVRGCVIKAHAVEDLIRALEEIQRGQVYLSPGVSRALVKAYLARKEVPPDPLTARERQVLQLVAEGKTTKEIAQLLEISVKGVESHRARIMDKLGIHHTAGLVRYAIRRGLTQV